MCTYRFSMYIHYRNAFQTTLFLMSNGAINSQMCSGGASNHIPNTNIHINMYCVCIYVYVYTHNNYINIKMYPLIKAINTSQHNLHK